MIIWQGPSRIDKSPIVAIATWGSKNPKTGQMIQVWIIRADMHPMQAIKSGRDSAVCGNCPMRGKTPFGLDRSCYVQLMCMGSIYKKFRAGKYDRIRWDDMGPNGIPSRDPIRISAYGDPCAVPLKVWRKLLTRRNYRGDVSLVPHTGYTRQWHLAKNKRYAELFHASVFSPNECRKAQSKGFKYFYPNVNTFDAISAIDQNVAQCVNSIHGVQCVDCLNCSGVSGSSTWIHSHGSRVKHFAANVKGL